VLPVDVGESGGSPLLLFHKSRSDERADAAPADSCASSGAGTTSAAPLDIAHGGKAGTGPATAEDQVLGALQRGASLRGRAAIRGLC
jgi:hypothetical protein